MEQDKIDQTIKEVIEKAKRDNPDQTLREVMESAKRSIKKGLPEVDFFVSAAGITVSSERLKTARYVPFDVQGKCHHCKADSSELDFAITPEGIMLFSPRLKGMKYLQFDTKVPIDNPCVFRVKCKGKVFNIPIGEEDEMSEEAMKEPTDEEEEAVKPLKKKSRFDPVLPVTPPMEKKDEPKEQTQFF